MTRVFREKGHARRLTGTVRATATAAVVTFASVSMVSSPLLSEGAAAGRPPKAGLFLPTPLATSVQTSDGTWATIPMGRLKEPDNTFWQLFYRPSGATSWSDKVRATATATNGGLVLASARGRALIVGVRPSRDLVYSPLISTSDGARSWSDGLLDEGLAPHPDAMATNGSGQAIALDRSGRKVLATVGGISRWRVLTTERALANTTQKSCGLGSLTAVAYRAGQPLVGGICSRPGVVGIFSDSRGAWRLAGPVLPRSLGGGPVEVLGLQTGADGASALLGVGRGSRASLVAAWSTSGGHWSTSAALALGANQDIASFGPAAPGSASSASSATGDGIFVLLKPRSAKSGPATSRPAGREDLFVEYPGKAWEKLPAPPANTETAAFGPGQMVTALAANHSVLSVWSLRPASGHWARAQVLRVAIQYGSSS